MLEFPASLPHITEFSELWEGYCSLNYDGFLRVRGLILWPFPISFPVSSFCFKCITLVTSFFSQSHVLYNRFCFPSFFPHHFFFQVWFYFSNVTCFLYYWRHFHLRSKKVNHKYSLLLEASLIMDRNILNTKLQGNSWTSSYALWFIIQIWCLILQEVWNPNVQSWNLLVQPFAQLFAYQQAETNELFLPGYDFFVFLFCVAAMFWLCKPILLNLIKSGFMVLFKNFLLVYKLVIMFFLFFYAIWCLKNGSCEVLILW